MGSRHDAATGTGNNHQVVACKRLAELAGERVQRMFDGRSRRAEYGHFAATLELIEAAEGVLHFTHGL